MKYSNVFPHMGVIFWGCGSNQEHILGTIGQHASVPLWRQAWGNHVFGIGATCFSHVWGTGTNVVAHFPRGEIQPMIIPPVEKFQRVAFLQRRNPDNVGMD